MNLNLIADLIELDLEFLFIFGRVFHGLRLAEGSELRARSLGLLRLIFLIKTMERIAAISY